MQSKQDTSFPESFQDVIPDRLRELDSEDRLLAGLYFYESLTVEEIAIVLEKEADRVESDLENLLIKLLPSPTSTEQFGAYASEVVG